MLLMREAQVLAEVSGSADPARLVSAMSSRQHPPCCEYPRYLALMNIRKFF